MLIVFLRQADDVSPMLQYDPRQIQLIHFSHNSLIASIAMIGSLCLEAKRGRFS